MPRPHDDGDTVVPALPVSAAAAEPPGVEAEADAVPDWIGPYRVLGRLGHGGMGTVFKAEQRRPVQRVVAVKVVRPGMDTAEVIARFQSERQALARMDHPNIAKVLDAGADDRGRPYFVMEYVPGSPIARFADENRLPIRRRLELILQVCDAVGHAHAKAVIHRDIKAGNVLAYAAAEGPRVKVIDFGVAKAVTADRLTDRTFNTALGQAIGTYESMSPEQAEGSPDIDTRTDVYALGALLYELLSGSKPFDKSNLARAAAEEVRRIIREEEPPRPSTQLSSGTGEQATRVANARAADVDGLARQLRSDLDWIPMMAMRKERDRRYATPQQLADDVRNYLDGRPLVAAPDSLGYRARKFARRNRGPIAAAAAVLLVLLLGIAGTTVGLVGQSRAAARAEAEKTRAEAALAEAQRQTAVAEAVGHFQADMLTAADPGQLLGDKVTVVQAMAAAVRRLDDGQFRDQPTLEAELRSVIGNTFNRLGRYAEAEANFRRAVQLRRAESPPQPQGLAFALNDLAGILCARQGWADAEGLLRESLDVNRRARAADDPAIGQVLDNLAVVLQEQGRLPEAEERAAAALAIMRHAPPEDGEALVTAFDVLGQVLQRRGKLPEAERLLGEALATARRSLPAGHPTIGRELQNLALLLEDEGKPGDAEALYVEALAINRKALPADHDEIARVLNNLALVYQKQGKRAEARAMLVDALGIMGRVFPAGDWRIGLAMNNLADLLSHDPEHLAEAQSMSQAAVDILRRAPPGGDRDRNSSGCLCILSKVLRRENRPAEELPVLRSALDIARTAYPADDPQIAAIVSALNEALAAERRQAAATTAPAPR